MNPLLIHLSLFILMSIVSSDINFPNGTDRPGEPCYIFISCDLVRLLTYQMISLNVILKDPFFFNLLQSSELNIYFAVALTPLGNC